MLLVHPHFANRGPGRGAPGCDEAAGRACSTMGRATCQADTVHQSTSRGLRPPNTTFAHPARACMHAYLGMCFAVVWKLCLSVTLQENGWGTDVHLSNGSWWLEVSPLAFCIISAELALKLRPPIGRLLPGTKLRLSPGKFMNHVIIELAPPPPPQPPLQPPPRTLPYQQLAAAAVPRLSVPLPARRCATAAPYCTAQGASAAVVQAASSTQQASPAAEQPAEQHRNSHSMQYREQNSSTAKRCKLMPAAEPPAQTGAATRLTVGGSVHTTAAAAAVPCSGASTVIRAAAIMYPQKCLPPSHQQAAAPRGSSPPNRKQHPAQPAGAVLQVPSGEAHLHPAPSCYMPVYRSCRHACTRPMPLSCQN